MTPHAQPEPRPRIDGRILRTQRTHARILAAAQAFADEGQYRPRADQIARRARISTRSIWQHFADLNALHLAALTDEHVRVICARLAMLAPRERVRALLSGDLPVLPS